MLEMKPVSIDSYHIALHFYDKELPYGFDEKNERFNLKINEITAIISIPEPPLSYNSFALKLIKKYGIDGWRKKSVVEEHDFTLPDPDGKISQRAFRILLKHFEQKGESIIDHFKEDLPAILRQLGHKDLADIYETQSLEEERLEKFLSSLPPLDNEADKYLNEILFPSVENFVESLLEKYGQLIEMFRALPQEFFHMNLVWQKYTSDESYSIKDSSKEALFARFNNLRLDGQKINKKTLECLNVLETSLDENFDQQATVHNASLKKAMECALYIYGERERLLELPADLPEGDSIVNYQLSWLVDN